jgi:hypothetical protein
MTSAFATGGEASSASERKYHDEPRFAYRRPCTNIAHASHPWQSADWLIYVDGGDFA